MKKLRRDNSATAMNRYTQWVFWLLFGAAVGLVQGLTTFIPVVIQYDLRTVGSRDLKTFALISLVYGTAWLTPTLLLADWLLLRRTLRAFEFRNYVGVIAISALFMGLVLPGIAMMIGFPLTSVAILITAYVCRKQREV